MTRIPAQPEKIQCDRCGHRIDASWSPLSDWSIGSDSSSDYPDFCRACILERVKPSRDFPGAFSYGCEEG